MICKEEDCTRDARSRGWCINHYRKARLELGEVSPPAPCVEDGCGAKGTAGRGLCPKHHRAIHGKPCTIDDCEKPEAARGWCDNHYKLWKKHGDPLVRKDKVRPPCSVDGCDRPHKGLGYCSLHYERFKKYGDVNHVGKVGRRRSSPSSCIYPGCLTTEKLRRGYCAMHYTRVLTHGDPSTTAGPTSMAETQVADFVRSLGVEIETGDRTLIKPMELDILIPARNVAVEFNGLFWHTESRKAATYHHTKWALCRAAGVQLIQVWEDDWRDRRPVVERMLRHKILGPDRRLGARQAQRVTLAKADADAFLAEYHIQGGAAGSHYRGLMHDGELVAVAVFRSRSDGRGELTRYAASVAVTGGLSKLMKGLPYGELVTFADHCVSDGRLYEATGWRNDGELAPDYRYVVGGRREHKFGYRLKRFREDPALLWEEGLTERELADLNGLDRIWDAGKTRYVLPLATAS